jgi:hypothetical protein
MNGILLVDKPKGWTSYADETNQRFFSSRRARNESDARAALFQESAEA